MAGAEGDRDNRGLIGVSAAFPKFGDGGAFGNGDVKKDDMRRDSKLPNLLDEGLLSCGVLDVANMPGALLVGESEG